MVLQLVIAHIPLAMFSVLAFLRPNALLFMLVGVIAIFVGLQWYDVYPVVTGLAIGMSLIAYGLVAFGFAFRCIFIRDQGREEGND